MHGVTQDMRGAYVVRAQGRPNHQTMGCSTSQGVQQYIMEMDRRPGVIVGEFKKGKPPGKPLLSSVKWCICVCVCVNIDLIYVMYGNSKPAL